MEGEVGESVPLLPRHFITDLHHVPIQETPETNPATTVSSSFTLLQFNTLADALSTDSFPHLVDNGACLLWPERKHRLIAEITRHQPHIICLEEVDHYPDFFLPTLQPLGFEGLFKGKCGDDSFDGCALFYAKDKFECVDTHSFALGERHSQVALIAHLRTRSQPSQDLYATVTHLKAKSEFEAKRLGQGVTLLRELNAFVSRSADTTDTHHDNTPRNTPAVVIAGDFNDVPGSPVYQYFAQQQSDATQQTTAHPFALRSAYAHYTAEGREPYSTYKKRETEVCRTIDFIWYSTQPPQQTTTTTTTTHLRLVGLLRIPPTSELPHRLPAPYYPSDHLAIGAQFQLITKHLSNL
eukprot:TRINITY_DN4420_c1_g2_i1.p1 TRINITY_DN4420_c1_g2~~TRINITY_DN4420_c1_g2_i1.p1  ORF type:complete len:353 (+),score=69.51 TRINITY_DN4420_c1_g2_i1:1-1059(+)